MVELNLVLVYAQVKNSSNVNVEKFLFLWTATGIQTRDIKLNYPYRMCNKYQSPAYNAKDKHFK